jgi:hypothetical protein
MEPLKKKTISFSKAIGLCKSFCHANPPVLEVWKQLPPSGHEFVTQVIGFIESYHISVYERLDCVDWNAIHIDRLNFHVDRAEEKIFEIFLSLPEVIQKSHANYSDMKLYHILRLFSTYPLLKAITRSEADMRTWLVGRQCLWELHQRLKANPIGRQLVQLKAVQDFDFPQPMPNPLEMLQAEIQPILKNWYMPQEATSHQRDARASSIHLSIVKLLEQMKELPLRDAYTRAAAGELEVLRTQAQNDFISELRKQTAQKRMPEGGIQSLDDEVELEDGTRVPLTSSSATENAQSLEIDEDFTQEQLNALDQALGETGRKIFVYRYQHQEIVGRGEGKIIARALEYTPSTVSKYLKIIEAKASMIKKIMIG